MGDQLIGIAGFARAGKNTVGQILEHNFGYKQVAFANKLKEFVYAANPYVEWDQEWGEPLRIQEIINMCGWERAKDDYPEVRRLLQATGSEAAREVFGPNVWVDALFRDLPKGLVAVTDCRFPNEALEIIRRGGVVVNILRPGVGGDSTHVSETAMEGFMFDFTITNDGTLEELALNVLAMMVSLRG